MLVKSSMLSQFTNDHQQQQQQQTPTSPSLQRNSSRIQTKSTAFNNNANYDGIEQDSPISNSFYQKGTNSKREVVVVVGKHLKATRIDINIDNSAIVDVERLTEQIRIIGIYCPQCQHRNLEDLTSYIAEKLS
ncbi:unnamed protein product [Rotaria socialis]|uniref:Uncharacterized protein n=1 Tax=Rotaria socialis TaxID=392032 RepID=A0A821V6F7_9BILA|nr:unnamed protein product [Rotaria socialis]